MVANAILCTVYTDVAGIHKMPVIIDKATKQVWFPSNSEPKEPISFLEEECWVELPDGTRIESDDCSFEGTYLED